MGTGRLYVFGVFAAILALSGLAGATSVKKSSKPGLASASQYETNNMGVDPVSDLSDAEVEQALKVAGKSSDALNRAISKSKKQKQKRAGTVRAQAKTQQRGDFVVDSYEQQMYRSMEKLGFKLRTADLHTSELEGAGGRSEAAGECVECQLPGHGGGGEKPGSEGKRFGAQKVSIIGEDDRERVVNENIFASIPSIQCRSYHSGKPMAPGSGTVVNREYGLILSTAHQFFDLDHPETKEEQIKTIPKRCKVVFKNKDMKIIHVEDIGKYDIDSSIGDVFSSDNVVSFVGDNIVFRVAGGTLPKFIVVNPTKALELSANINNMNIRNIGFHHVPDDPTTPVDEEMVHAFEGRGIVRQHFIGGSKFGRYLFKHDIDTNGYSSGSRICVLRTDSPSENQELSTASNCTTVGIDVGAATWDNGQGKPLDMNRKPYHEVGNFNVGRKITSDILDRLRALIK